MKAWAPTASLGCRLSTCPKTATCNLNSRSKDGLDSRLGPSNITNHQLWGQVSAMKKESFGIFLATWRSTANKMRNGVVSLLKKHLYTSVLKLHLKASMLSSVSESWTKTSWQCSRSHIEAEWCYAFSFFIDRLSGCCLYQRWAGWTSSKVRYEKLVALWDLLVFWLFSNLSALQSPQLHACFHK